MMRPHEDEVLALFRESGAMLDGHFVLSSGLHSGRYLQCALVLQHPRKAAQLGTWLASCLRAAPVDVVIGPALGGIIIAHEVARVLGVRAVFAERRQGVMSLRRGFRIEPFERVALVEDVATTGESLSELAAIVRSAGGQIVEVCAIVDRRVRDEWLLERPLFSLVRMHMPTYPATECPLCREQVPLDTPGTRQTS